MPCAMHFDCAIEHCVRRRGGCWLLTLKVFPQKVCSNSYFPLEMLMDWWNNTPMTSTPTKADLPPAPEQSSPVPSSAQRMYDKISREMDAVAEQFTASGGDPEMWSYYLKLERMMKMAVQMLRLEIQQQKLAVLFEHIACPSAVAGHPYTLRSCRPTRHLLPTRNVHNLQRQSQPQTPTANPQSPLRLLLKSR